MHSIRTICFYVLLKCVAAFSQLLKDVQTNMSCILCVVVVGVAAAAATCCYCPFWRSLQSAWCVSLCPIHTHTRSLWRGIRARSANAYYKPSGICSFFGCASNCSARPNPEDENSNRHKILGIIYIFNLMIFIARHFFFFCFYAPLRRSWLVRISNARLLFMSKCMSIICLQVGVSLHKI